MNLDLKSIATGALAGLASALMVLAAASHLSASSVFLILAAMPVFIAGLAFGAVSAVSALVASFAVLALTMSPLFALPTLALSQLPAAWLARLANLARPASEIGGPANVMAWYPLSDMLNQLCAIIAVVVALTLVISGYSFETASSLVANASSALAKQDPTFYAGSDLVGQVTAIYYYLLPASQAMMAVVIVFAAYYFSAIIVRIATSTLRPREDMPSALRMPRNGLYAFGFGLLMLAIGGGTHINGLTVVGAAISGAFGGGFLLAGLAAFHFKTRGKSWRTPALVLAYLTISLSGFIFMIAGLFDTRRAIALTPVDGNSTDTRKH